MQLHMLCRSCGIIWSQTLPLMFNGVRHSNRFGRLLKNPIHKSRMCPIPELYELLFTTKQNGEHVNEYLATKKALWEELL